MRVCKKFRNIFLCASIEENQKPILDKEMIDLIQTNSTLINVSRGELIDEDYLIKSSVKKILSFLLMFCKMTLIGMSFQK